MKSIKRTKKSKKWVWLVLVAVVVIAGGAGYWFWNQQTTTAAAAATDTTTKTSTVREGNLTITVSGSGTLVAGKERGLGFSSSGTLASLNVQVGDTVKLGDILARLDAENIEDLQSEVEDAQDTLKTAQEDLDTLMSSGPVNLANAQLALTDAETALSDAQSGLLNSSMTRCDQDTIEARYFQYMNAQQSLDALGDGGGKSDYYLNIILPAKNAVASAKSAYEYCQGFFAYEITASQANLTLAQAKLDDARATLEKLTANNGIDPLEQKTAENKVASAQLALDTAEENLAGTTITAPFDGTVLSISSEVGDDVGASSLITLADLAHPRIEFSVDETDLNNVFTGEKANITFDALPDDTFTGTVLRVDPSLTSSSGYKVVTGLIEMDLSTVTDTSNLIKGLNATVELVSSSATNALLIPVQALHDLGDGTYSVFVMENGQPKMRMITIGIQDAASVEVTSGLSVGDVVTTGVVQTN